MGIKHIFSRFALIGDDLELKKNVNLKINNNGKISKVSYDDSEFIEEGINNTANNIIVPSFINSHVHIGDSFAKEIGFNKDLIEVVAPPTGIKHITLEKTSNVVKIVGIQKAVMEMLSNGISCFVDFREGGVNGINILTKALEGSPMRFLKFGRFRNLEDMDKVFESADGLGLASYKAITSENKQIIREKKKIFKKPISCHAAELIRNEELLNSLFHDNLVDIIVHGTQFKKKDLEIIKQSNLSLILCPRSNGYFGVGFPPINEILKLELPIALGTDNIMVNNTDLFEEIRYLYRVSRVLGKNDKNGVILSAKELLKMVTINAARIFHLDKEIGSIDEGKIADFFIVDLNDINFYTNKLTKDNLLPIILQRTKSENIKKVYIGGELVYKRN
jgi:cytosine/adenosine deaminase-related metal-dependent hydrolase